MSDMFLYYQLDGTSAWMPAPATQRDSIMADIRPKYITVLDLSAIVPEQPDPEELAKIKYRGPFYADWDCESIEDGAASVNRFLDDLEAMNVDLNCLSIYATGGRGYHVEIPFAVFSNNVNATVQYLPAIWLEIANLLYTDDMDLKVYSAKRGRMWRTPNVEREQPGRFKVPLTLQQMRQMTPELYAELTSAPQPYPELSVAKLSPSLAARFVEAKKMIEQRFRERKNKKPDDSAVKRMEGLWPDSVLRVMSGENISPNVGLNKIALQLGILSSALGKTEEEHIKACEGLIRNYRGDGHPTLASVRKELRRMYRYAAENVCYSYSPSAMAAIMESTVGVNDLRGPAGPTSAEMASGYSDLAQGMLNGSNGLYSNHAERGMHRECNWHFDSESVAEIVDANSLQTKGFTLMGKRDGRVDSEVNVDHGTFISADRAKSFLAAKGGVAPRLDTTKAGGILALIMDSSRGNNQIHVLDKEGIVLVERPEEDPEVVWSSPSGCLSHSGKYTYRYRAISGSEAGNFQSDVALAKQLKDFSSQVLIDTLSALFNFNENPHTVATVLGWFMSCWHKPLYLKWGEQFPILQLHGESGAGKTALAQQLLSFFYYRNNPRMISAVSGTPYGRRVMFSASSSIPLLVDEFKPHQMGPEQARAFRMEIHKMYTPQMQAPRGGGDQRSSMPGQWGEVVNETMTTPMLFTTEHPETETAIQERVLSASFTKAARRTQEAKEAFETLRNNKDVLAAFGRLMLNATAQAPLQKIRNLFDRSQALAKERLERNGNDRVVYNVGVALAGLTFFEMIVAHEMKSAYDQTFREAFETLREELIDPRNQEALQAEPEIIKLLRLLIVVSHTEDDSTSDVVCRLGKDFHYTPTGDLDLNVDSVYMRYRSVMQRRGMLAKFPDVDSFMLSLSNANVAIGADPADSAFLQADYKVRVIRLDGEMLMREYDLGMFKMDK